MTDETFAGFVPPVNDFFRMPNEWINICAKITNIAELKIVQYVLRHTWGYQEYDEPKKITIDEFMYGRKRKDKTRIDDGTGLSKQSVIDGIERAIKHGFLICERDDKDKARQKKYYQLHMRSGVKNLDSHSDVKELDTCSGVKNLDSPGVKDLDHDVKELDTRGVESRHRTEKDTIETHLEKNTLERQESNAPASLSAFAERKKATNPELPAITQEMLAEKVIPPKITLPSKQTPPPQSQVSGPPDGAPSASVASTAQTGVGAELPAMALTAKQIKQQNDRRAKDIWAIIERERQTKYSRTQRELYENSKGMECLLNDEIDDETLVKALGAMDPYQGRNFTLLKFYGWMPNLTAGAGPPSPNGKPAACQDDPTLGISGLPKLHPRKPIYPDPHEQPRKGPRYA